MTYNDDDQVTSETDLSYASGAVTTNTQTTNDYKLYAKRDGLYDGVDIGVITQSTSVQIQTGVTGTITQQTSYTYQWWAQAKEASITVQASNSANPNATTSAWAPGLSDMIYDVNGHLSELIDHAGDRVVFYQNDAYGQVLVSQEWDSDPSYLAGQGQMGPRHLTYFLDGHAVGDISNNGPNPNQVDYAQQLAADAGQPEASSGFRGGKPVTSADFDENYQPINAGYPAATATSYTVHSGDTLQSIALAQWGDASLWYLIADANGLTAGSTLVTGQVLSIPNKVTNLHNNSSTFKVYNPGQAIGDQLPTLPPEPAPPPPPSAAGSNGGCGGIGEILVAIVAIAVTVATGGAGGIFGGALNGAVGGVVSDVAGNAVGDVVGDVVGGAVAGAAGDVAGQAVGLATGVQSQFSWSGVALGALGGGIGGGLAGGLPNSDFSNAFEAGAVRGAVGSALTQGVGVATGLQSSFNWSGVVAGGLGGGVSSAVGATGWAQSLDSAGDNFISGAAGAIASAASTSVMNGTDFGSNLLQQLPSVIGNTIGNAIASDETVTPISTDQLVTLPADAGQLSTYLPSLPDGSGDQAAAMQVVPPISAAEMAQITPVTLPQLALAASSNGGPISVSQSASLNGNAGPAAIAPVDEVVVTGARQNYGLSYIPHDLFIGAFSAVDKDLAGIPGHLWNGVKAGWNYLTAPNADQNYAGYFHQSVGFQPGNGVKSLGDLRRQQAAFSILTGGGQNNVQLGLGAAIAGTVWGGGASAQASAAINVSGVDSKDDGFVVTGQAAGGPGVGEYEGSGGGVIVNATNSPPQTLVTLSITPYAETDTGELLGSLSANASRDGLGNWAISGGRALLGEGLGLGGFAGMQGSLTFAVTPNSIINATKWRILTIPDQSTYPK